MLTWQMEGPLLMEVHDDNWWMVPTVHAGILIVMFCKSFKVKISLHNRISWGKLHPCSPFQILYHSADSSMDLRKKHNNEKTIIPYIFNCTFPPQKDWITDYTKIKIQNTCSIFLIVMHKGRSRSIRSLKLCMPSFHSW